LFFSHKYAIVNTILLVNQKGDHHGRQESEKQRKEKETDQETKDDPSSAYEVIVLVNPVYFQVGK
jgi:hypothetical protein